MHGKSNLAPHGNSLVFGLDPTSGFTWLGDYEITLEELPEGRKQKQQNQFGRAQESIGQVLAKGSVASVELFREGEEQGLSPKTLNKAKGAMDIKSFRRVASGSCRCPIRKIAKMVSLWVLTTLTNLEQDVV